MNIVARREREVEAGDVAPLQPSSPMEKDVAPS